MSDPPRLLSGLEGGSVEADLERTLLASLRDASPPATAKAATWGRIASEIGAASLVAGAGAGAAPSGALGGAGAASGALKLTSAKVLIALATAGVLAGGGATWVHERRAPAAVAPPREPPAPVPPPLPPSAAAPAPDVLAPDAPPALVPSVPASRPTAPRALRAAAPPPSASSDALRRESALLTEARASLRAGDPAAARRTLQRMQAEFPAGVLWQEREVVGIEALAASGQTQEAARQARAFIEAHPSSPHKAALARLVPAAP